MSSLNNLLRVFTLIGDFSSPFIGEDVFGVNFPGLLTITGLVVRTGDCLLIVDIATRD